MLNEDMKYKLQELNQNLLDREKIKPLKKDLRIQLSNLGEFHKLETLSSREMEYLSDGRGIVGIDGSYTTYGNTHPHVLFLAQALAKCTDAKNDEGVKQSDIFTGFDVDNINSPDANTDFMRKASMRVTQMEVEVATEALTKYNPFITMFDGGFWRLDKDAEKQWERFVNETLDKDILAVGVIEDAGSYDLHDKDMLNLDFFIPDSDILFNLLEVGEVFVIKQLYRDKFKRAFARFSKDPLPIACDFLPEQENSILDMLRLTYTLTPNDGRGIPLWIDIVDNEVKLTREATESIVNAYIDPKLKERLFTGKRNRREVY